MISEFIKTIKVNLYERATSPLAGAILISWCLWNYPVLIILFSSLDPQEKIKLIQESLINYPRSVWGPLLTSAFFVFIYPFPARLVYWFSRKQKKVLRDVRQKIEDEELLTKEESRNIRREIYNIQIDHENEIKRKNDDTNRLKEILSEKDEEIERVTTESAQKTEQLKEKDDLLKRKDKELAGYISKLALKIASLGEPILFDNFDSDQGWEQYLEGAVARSKDVQAHSGKFCLKKQNNNDPHGGFKRIGQKLGLGFIFSGWIYRPSNQSGGKGDRIAIEDAEFNGYGFGIAHASNFVEIERRDKGAATSISNRVQFNPPQDKWYNFELHANQDGKFSLYLNNSRGDRLVAVDATDSTYNEFDRVTIHGGHSYYIDDIKIITTHRQNI